MITAEHDRRHAFFEGAQDLFGCVCAGLGDLLEVAGVLLADLLGFGDGNSDVAAVIDFVAEGLQARFKSRDSDGRRAHVHAAARGSEIERDADNFDAPRGQRLHSGVGGTSRCRCSGSSDRTDFSDS